MPVGVTRPLAALQYTLYTSTALATSSVAVSEHSYLTLEVSNFETSMLFWSLTQAQLASGAGSGGHKEYVNWPMASLTPLCAHGASDEYMGMSVMKYVMTPGKVDATGNDVIPAPKLQ